MTQSLTQFLTSLSHAFCTDRLEYLAQHVTYPLPLYTRGELLVFGAPTALIEALGMYRKAAHDADIEKIVPRVIATGIPHKGYSNLWVEWDHFDASDNLICTSQVRYAIFHDKMALHPKIEMVDYTSMAFPEVSESLPLLQSA
ncbi:hypothetical protein [uncultured Tateyamaria sp.]|uniref:hypothetical protein n=1 Tax=uncultured Tateyamaria sp. TaxID=455651 RepID=UPI0026238816|nr:hypothetical protein [uncultured Tateyamaria sp.]